MRILKDGLPEQTIYIFTCTNCDSTIEAKEHEKTGFFGEFLSDGFINKAIIFRCPVCDNKVTIKK